MRLAFAFAILSALGGVARADIESEEVKAGQAAYDDLNYQLAVDHLQKALKETLTREEKRVAFTTLAFAYVSLGQKDAGRKAFEQLIRIDPDFQLDRTHSPKMRAVFEEAKRSVATGAGIEANAGLPQLKPEAPRIIREGKSASVHVSYPGGVGDKLEIYYRTRGQLRFTRMLVVGKKGQFDLTIPAREVQPPAVEYYCDVLDDNGAALAVAGSLGRPLAIDVDAKKVPVYKKGWFWGTIVAIAAAGAVGGALGWYYTQPATGNATLTIHPFAVFH
jgi:tetratricopeptide (TPR) repeat protein